MRKSRRDYKNETTRDPYELNLDNPTEDGRTFVTFRNPNKLESESAFDLDLMRPAAVFELLLSEEEYKAWWAEWRTAPIEETNALLEDVQIHYGATPGKRGR
jgi:hypothetical protein